MRVGSGVTVFMRVSRGVRNVVMVALAFGAVAILIVLARYRPPSHVLPPESPEITRLRFSRTENAWFVLQEAVQMIPPYPNVDPRTTVDFEPGPMGSFSGILLPDDNPEHAAWVRACKPVIDRARDALAMDHLLLAEDLSIDEEPWQRIRTSNAFRDLPGIMLATAALESTPGGNPQTALACFKDALRLSLMLRNAIPHLVYIPPKSLCRLARRFDPRIQREALIWLFDFNQSKPRMRRAAEDMVRMHDAWKGGWKQRFRPLDPRHMPYEVRDLIHSGPARRVFAANVEAILDACCYTESEYLEWERRFPLLADAAASSFPVLSIRSWMCRPTTEYQAGLDAVELVLAIELFRREHGSYPESLEALAPEFLPRLPARVDQGKVFFYRRADPGYWFAMPYDEVSDPTRLPYSYIVVSPIED